MSCGEDVIHVGAAWTVSVSVSVSISVSNSV